MEFPFLSLRTSCFEAMVEFYRTRFELPVLCQGKEFAVLSVGATQLLLQEAPGNPYYHFAIDIPSARMREIFDCSAQRLALLEEDGEREFVFEDWNATSIYCHDPAGNIVELIARHGVDEPERAPGFPHCLLRISEIGWPSADPELVANRLDLPRWRDYGALKAVGAETALVLLVTTGRGWKPTRRPAEFHPFQCVLATADGQRKLIIAEQ